MMEAAVIKTEMIIRVFILAVSRDDAYQHFFFVKHGKKSLVELFQR
jgi:hypothetical protein